MWASFLCKVLGHKRPAGSEGYFICPRCWRVVVPPMVKP